MLSAVAARKSRLQQQQQSFSSGSASPALVPPSPTPGPSTHASNETQNHGRQKPNSKRKASNTSQPPGGKKKRKSKPSSRAVSPPRHTRYFQHGYEEDDRMEEDVTDNDDNQGSDSDDSDDSFVGEEPDPNLYIENRMLVDEEDQDNRDSEPPPSPPSRPFPQNFQSKPLSTFIPKPDVNIFTLTFEQKCQLGLGIDPSTAVTIVSLTTLEKLALVGTYKLTVLRGAITICGTLLQPSSIPHRVFAPWSSPIPVIEASLSIETDVSVEVPLPAVVTQVLGEVKSGDGRRALVLINEMKSGVEGLGKVCRTFEKVFHPLRGSQTEDIGIPSAQMVTASISYAPFDLPGPWHDALSSSIPIPAEQDDYSRRVYYVKGAKKSGKSTFARLVLNRLSTQYKYVAFLECDVGQSEFTPGGMVALNIVSSPIFGPPFTHPSIPCRAHYIGSASPQSSPSHYLASIQSLIDTYNTEIQHATFPIPDLNPISGTTTRDERIDDFVPLVVNMMGWTKGLGADLTMSVEDIIQPTFVFEFEPHSYEDSQDWTSRQPFDRAQRGGRPVWLEEDQEEKKEYQVFKVPPAPRSRDVLEKFTATDHRHLSILSYFHAVFPSQSQQRPHETSYHPIPSPTSPIAIYWDTALPLCAQLPYELSSSAALSLVVLTGPGSEDVVPSEISRVLNGAIVALVSHSPGAFDIDVDVDGGGTIGRSSEEERELGAVPYVQGTTPPLPALSTCHGLALVRSISPPYADANLFHPSSHTEPSTSSSASSPTTLLHLLTPLPPSTLLTASPRILVKGDLELPIWGMLDFRLKSEGGGGGKKYGDKVAGIMKGEVPYLRWGTSGGEAVGETKRRARRNLMRSSQM